MQDFLWNDGWEYTSATIEGDGTVWINQPGQCVNITEEQVLEIAAAILATAQQKTEAA